MSNNKEAYRTVDFDFWAYKQNLSQQEKFILETYLDKEGKTVEAGTAGGRIVLEMQKLGFTSLYGFDYVPEFIEQAKQRDTTNSISFTVGDATSLNYDDGFFDQIVYIQQIICCIEDDLGRLNALKEAYRILRKGGTALFSFLNFDYRLRKPAYLPYLMYLRILRGIGNSQWSLQYIPRLKLGGKLNLNALLDRQPYMYWYKLDEAYQSLKAANFEIVGVASDLQLRQGKIHPSLETLRQEPIQGMLYFICQK